MGAAVHHQVAGSDEILDGGEQLRFVDLAEAKAEGIGGVELEMEATDVHPLPPQPTEHGQLDGLQGGPAAVHHRR